MHVLCAPDTFKETISAIDAAEALARGARSAAPGVVAEVLPIADGGEGTLDILHDPMGLEITRMTVSGPRGDDVEARYGVDRDTGTAVVELADASGLARLTAGQRDPTRTTTFGTGQLMRDAMQRGCRSILLIIGGSATCDGGAGIAQALGATFHDDAGQRMRAPITGGDLVRIQRITPPTSAPEIRIACDVSNPLLGPGGAAAVYGPQKGADPPQVAQLEAGLTNLASRLGADPTVPGFGAAGGVALALTQLFEARLARGIDLVLDAVRFTDRCRHATLVLTGEGRLDEQTLQGKACLGVARVAASVGVPTIAIVGTTGPGAEWCIGTDGLLSGVVSLSERYGEERARRDVAELLCETAREVVAARMEATKPQSDEATKG